MVAVVIDVSKIRWRIACGYTGDDYHGPVLIVAGEGPAAPNVATIWSGMPIAKKIVEQHNAETDGCEQEAARG